MPSSHYYRPVDPGYGAIGQGIGGGIAGAAQGFQQNRFRQAALAQDAEQQAQMAAYRDAQLGIAQRNAARLEEQARMSGITRGVLPNDMAGPISEAYGDSLGPGVAVGGDRTFFPNYSGAVHQAHAPAELDPDRAAGLIYDRMGVGGALNRETHMPDAINFFQELGLGDQGYAREDVLSSLFSSYGGQRSPLRERPEDTSDQAVDAIYNAMGVEGPLHPELHMPAAINAFNELGLEEQGFSQGDVVNRLFNFYGGRRAEPRSRADEPANPRDVAAELFTQVQRNNPTIFESPEEYRRWLIGEATNDGIAGGGGNRVLESHARLSGVDAQDLRLWLAHFAGFIPAPEQPQQ